MVKKKVDKLNKPKLDLGQTLYALDTRDFDYYDNLSEEEKKKYSALLLMRFMSSAPNQGGLHEYHISSTNEIVNLNLWAISKFPDLQHKLLCLCGLGKKQYHQWIPMAKKINTNKLFQFFMKVYPALNQLEFEILIKNIEIEEFKELCKIYALEDKEIEDLTNQFKNIKNADSND